MYTTKSIELRMNEFNDDTFQYTANRWDFNFEVQMTEVREGQKSSAALPRCLTAAPTEGFIIQIVAGSEGI